MLSQFSLLKVANVKPEIKSQYKSELFDSHRTSNRKSHNEDLEQFQTYPSDMQLYQIPQINEYTDELGLTPGLPPLSKAEK